MVYLVREADHTDLRRTKLLPANLKAIQERINGPFGKRRSFISAIRGTRRVQKPPPSNAIILSL